jgi:hypothetical protein
MMPCPMHTAPMAVGQNEEPVSILLDCPEEGGWRRGVWLRAAWRDGEWLSQGWRLTADPRVVLRPTQWLPCSDGPVAQDGCTSSTPAERHC